MTDLLFLLICFIPALVWLFRCRTSGEFSRAVLFGALFSAFVAVPVCSVLQYFLFPLNEQISGVPGMLFSAFIRVSLVEESAKLGFVFLFAISRIRRSASLRALLALGLLASLSFAALENIAYFLRFPSLLPLRFFTSLPLHASATVLAVFAFARPRGSTVFRFFAGFTAVVFFHGLYNIGLEAGGGFLVLSLASLLVMVIAAFGVWTMSGKVEP